MKNAKVAIVGSGVAAITIADILLESSAASHITMFEAGSVVPMGDRRVWLDYVTTGWKPYTSNQDISAEVEGDEKKFQIVGGRLMVVGGSTMHWGGWCPRFKPEDFKLKTNAGKGLDWQFDYDDLAPFYAKAEQRLQVAGDSERNDPPRHGVGYPVSAVPLPQKDGPVLKALESLGLGNFGNLPIARNDGCQTTGTCKYCPVGGKYDATMDMKPNSSKFYLRSNCPVVEIVMESKSNASGVKFMDLETGSVEFEDFEYVVVCGGTLESAKLLLASKSGFWPDGLGNDTDHVGRHLIAHALIRSSGAIASNPKAYEQELDFPTLECRAFDTELQQPEGKFYFVRDGRGNRIDFADELANGAKTLDLENRLVAQATFTLSGFVEEFEAPESKVELGAGKNRFGLPNTKIRYASPDETQKAKLKWLAKMDEIILELGVEKASIEHTNYNPRCDHAVSTCRMSATAADGVVDRNGRIHDCENVYICSNAIFPNVAAVNPTLTLTAVAIKIAEFLSR